MVHIIRCIQDIAPAMSQQVSVKERQDLHQKTHVYVMKKRLYKERKMRKNLKEARQKAGMTQIILSPFL